MMEEHRPHIIQMPIQREQTSTRLIRPHLDLVVISPGHKQRLCLVEVDPSYGTVVLFKAVYERAHPVIP